MFFSTTRSVWFFKKNIKYDTKYGIYSMRFCVTVPRIKFVNEARCDAQSIDHR